MAKSRATEDALDDLHRELARALTDKVKTGTASAADLNVIRQFLKDNGVDSAANPEGVAKLGSVVSDIDESELPENVTPYRQ